MQTIDMHRSGGGGPPRPAGKIISLKIFFAHYMILRVYTVMVRGLGGLECFNGPHDGYANSKEAGQIDAYFVKIKFATKFASRYTCYR